MVIAIELIISGIVYLLSNGALAAIIAMMKKASAKKYKEIVEGMSEITRRNTEIYTILSEGKPSERSNLDDVINEPISEMSTPQNTHRDIQLQNGNILRIHNK